MLKNTNPPAHGSVEVSPDGRVIYTDDNGIRWRLHDFDSDAETKRSLKTGSEWASCRVFVREDQKERRRALFNPHRHNTLTAEFCYHHIATAAVFREGRWVNEWSVRPTVEA